MSNPIKKYLKKILKIILMVSLLILCVFYALPPSESRYIPSTTMHKMIIEKEHSIVCYNVYYDHGTVLLEVTDKNGHTSTARLLAGDPSISMIYNQGKQVVISPKKIFLSQTIASFVLSLFPICLLVLSSRSVGLPDEFRADFLIKPKDIKFSDMIGLKSIKSSILRSLKYRLYQQKQVSKDQKKKPLGIFGALFHGKPGTGKTMLAQAIAGEVGKIFNQKTYFFFVNCSTLSQIFVGTGEAKLKQLFYNARNCGGQAIIFFEEAESAFASRNSAGSEYRSGSGVVSALLAEMDGASDNSNIIAIFATNYKDKLDEALLRNGRIGYVYGFPLANLDENREYWKLTGSLSDEDGFLMAKMTNGRSFAFIDGVYSLAKEHACGKKIDLSLLKECLREKIMGIPIENRYRSDKSRYATAIHESGHALAVCIFNRENKLWPQWEKEAKQDLPNPEVGELMEATIVHRSNALGMVIRISHEDKDDTGVVQLIGDIIVGIGGQVGERLHDKYEVSPGCSSDFSKVREMLRMHFLYRMGQGVNSAGAIEPNIDLQSDYDKQIITQQVSESMNKLYGFTTNLIKDNWGACKAIADKLIEKQTLDKNEIFEIFYQHEIKFNHQEYMKIIDHFTSSY